MATLIKPNSEPQVMTPNNKPFFSLKELQDAVEGYIEILHISVNGTRKIAVFNEEGKINNLEPNLLATHICGSWLNGDVLLGNVIIADLDEID